MYAAHDGRKVADVESAAAEGQTAELVVAGGTNGAELPDTGKRVHEALLDSLRRFVKVRRRARVGIPARTSWHPEDLLERELAQNAKTWAALQRLGVGEGSEIPLDFFFQTAGPDADRKLAEYLRSLTDYQVVVEPDGVSGRTRPMPLSAIALDEWVRSMLYTGCEHGRCQFAGWTATLSR
jgi:hypothetical protein